MNSIGAYEVVLVTLIVIGVIVVPACVIVWRIVHVVKDDTPLYVSPFPGAPPVPVKPDGWYPDPTGRHELRWLRYGRWTAQVCDAGTVADDPI